MYIFLQEIIHAIARPQEDTRKNTLNKYNIFSPPPKKIIIGIPGSGDNILLWEFFRICKLSKW